MRFKTIIALVLLMVATTATPALADDHNERRSWRDGVWLLTPRTSAVAAGESVWLTFNWTSRGQDVSDFSATVTANNDVTVEYPENTEGFTGLMEGHNLSDGEVDFTAVKLTVPYDTQRFVRLTFDVSYVDSKGEAQSDRYRSWVPINRWSGEVEVTQLDAEASIPTGSGAWVDVDFTTRAPRADALTLTVVNAAGLSVEYPDGANSTSLHFDDRLSKNETDTARFYVNTEGMSPGDYVVEIETTYEIDGEKKVMPGTVAVSVTG